MSLHGVIGLEFSSSSVIATAMKADGDKALEPLAEHCEPVFFKEPATPEEFVAGMHFALETAATAAQKALMAAKLQCQNVFCVYGSPWHVSDISVVRKEYQKPTRLSAKQIEEMVTAQVEDHRKALEKKAGTSLHCIESRHILTHLNGYRIASPVAADAVSLSITHVTSYVAKDDFQELEKKVKSLIRGAAIHHSTVAAWIYPKASASSDTISDSAIIHVSGETTDIAVLSDDALVSIMTVPSGIHGIIRALEKKAKIGAPMNESILAMIHDGQLDESANPKAGKAVAAAVAEWTDALKDALAAAKLPALPADVFLHAEPKRVAAATMLLTDPRTVELCFGTTPPKIQDVSRLFI
jgi:hypothetical protein